MIKATKEHPESLQRFITKLRSNQVVDPSTLINQLLNIDVDIFLNFNPNRCLFIETYLNLETKGKKKTLEDDEENILMAYDEDAMLGKALLKEEDIRKLKDDHHNADRLLKQKCQKDMTPDEMNLMFMMQGVLIDTFIKAVKVDMVTKSAFIGTMVRFVENINRHLISEGGFFSIVINLRFGRNAVFYFDEQESVFKVNYYNSPLLDMIDDPTLAYNKQYIIKDIMDCGNLNEAKVALEFHETLLKISKDYSNNSFKHCSPDKSVMLTHFLKLKNQLYDSKRDNQEVKSITFLSVHQLYSSVEKKKGKKLNKESASEAASLHKLSRNLDSMAAKSQNLEGDSLIKELHNLKPETKSYDAVYKQIAVFLNYFSNFTDFIQIINERASLDTFNNQIFRKFDEALASIESDK